MYDVGELTSLGHLRSWFDDAKSYAPPEDPNGRKTLYFIVGNKTDLSSGTVEVTEERVEVVVNDILPNLPESHFFRISVKNGRGFDDMFSKMAKLLSEKIKPATPNKGGVNMVDPPEETKSTPPLFGVNMVDSPEETKSCEC